MPERIRCDLLLFYATTTERQQLEVVARELELPFQRQRHETLGRYYSLGMVGDFQVIAVRTEMGPLKDMGNNYLNDWHKGC